MLRLLAACVKTAGASEENTVKRYLLGIDVGASGIKLALIKTDGRLAALEHLPHIFTYPRPGWAEIDPRGWWQAITAGIPRLLKRADAVAPQVVGVGVSSMMTLLALDRAGEPVRPAIPFLDTRAASQVEVMNQLVDPAVTHRLSGNRVAAGAFSATSMRWIAENEPEVWRRTAAFGHGNTYVVARLTGELAMDWVMATTSGLYEIDGPGGWSDTLCAGFGIPREKLLPVVAPAAAVGVVTARAAAESGLAAGTPVAMGAVDTACAALGSGVVRHGQLFESVGTSGTITVCSDTPTFDVRFLNRRHVVPGKWLFMGGTSAPGAAITWFRDQFGAAEAVKAEREGRPVFEVMEDLALSSPPGANQLLFLPYLSGERSPIWDPRARGVFFGLSLATTRADAFRAVLEGGAFGMRQNLEIAEGMLGGPVPEILAVGGGARSALWCQIKADVSHRPVRALALQEASVTGAALLGGVAAGVYADCRAAAAVAPREGRLFSPRPELAAMYDDLYAIFSGLYPALKEAYARLDEVRPPLGAR